MKPIFGKHFLAKRELFIDFFLFIYRKHGTYICETFFCQAQVIHSFFFYIENIETVFVKHSFCQA